MVFLSSDLVAFEVLLFFGDEGLVLSSDWDAWPLALVGDGDVLFCFSSDCERRASSESLASDLAARVFDLFGEGGFSSASNLGAAASFLDLVGDGDLFFSAGEVSAWDLALAGDNGRFDFAGEGGWVCERGG